jgi:hypothetical protein
MVQVEYSEVRRLSGSEREGGWAVGEEGPFGVPLGEETVVLELQFDLPEDPATTGPASNGQEI